MRPLRCALGFALLVSGLAWSVAHSGQEPFQEPTFALGTGPRVLYDTAHHNPPANEGRYRGVLDLLRADGYQVVARPVPFDRRQLAEYHVVLIVVPYAADLLTDPRGAQEPVFSDAEIQTLVAWVRGGGTLLLVFGHEPSGVANANLAGAFGMDLRNSTTMDATPENNWIEGDPACLGCLKFTIENGLLREHPITRGFGEEDRVRSVMSAAGSSISVPHAGDVLLALGPEAYDLLPGGETLPAYGRAQGVAMSFGEGRVVALADGSILSGGSDNENPRFRRWWPTGPDNRQFTINLLRWHSGVLPLQ